MRTWYEIFVYSFCDSDGDGIGDLKGVDSKLDYLQELGVTGIWLMPIHPAMSYHKYDVTDYEAISPDYGTMDDFEKLLADCHKRGIKLIMDLVVNHTASDYPWFQKAAAYLKEHPDCDLTTATTKCPEVGYYNFVKTDTKQGGYEKLEGTSFYYEAQFSKKMPDLNLDKEEVRKYISEVMQFWLKKGVDGFRLDAAKEYYTGNSDKNIEMLSFLEKTLKTDNPNGYMVAEVWDTFATITKYYQSGITSIFNYPFGNSDGQIVKVLRNAGNGKMVEKYARNLEKSEESYRKSNAEFIDAPFLSNHDTGRIEGFLGGDEDKIKMAGAMNLMMSGSAFIYYGEELGMSGSGNDPSKRAPMYWSSKADPEMTDPPQGCVSQENPFGSYQEQKDDPNSVLSYYKKASQVRNEYRVIATGVTTAEEALNKGCISAVRKTDKDTGKTCILLMNISDQEQQVSLAGYEDWKLGDIICTGTDQVVQEKTALTMPAYSIAVLTQS